MKILLAALLLAPPPVRPVAPPAVQAPGAFPSVDKPFVRAHRGASCADWLSAREGKGRDSRLYFGIYRTWLASYVSAFNIVGPDPTGNLMGSSPWEEAYSFIDRHCARNPSHEVVDSMHPMIREFIGRRPGPPPASAPRAEKRKATNSMWLTCKEWIEDSPNKILRYANGASVRGYLTGYNHWGPDPKGDAVGPVKDDIVDNWIDGWCAGRPPATAILLAMEPLIDHLASERKAGRLPPAGKGPADEFTPGSQEPR